MNSIVHENKSNLGSISQIYFVETDMITNNPRILDGKVLEAVSISGSAPWKSIYSTRNKPAFSENESMDGAKVIFNQVVSGYIPRDSESIRKALESGKRNRYSLLVKDSNSLMRWVGTPKNPCLFSFQFGTGTSIIGGNGYSFSFQRRSRLPAPVYDLAFSTE